MYPRTHVNVMLCNAISDYAMLSSLDLDHEDV